MREVLLSYPYDQLKHQRLEPLKNMSEEKTQRHCCCPGSCYHYPDTFMLHPTSLSNSNDIPHSTSQSNLSPQLWACKATLWGKVNAIEIHEKCIIWDIYVQNIFYEPGTRPAAEILGYRINIYLVCLLGTKGPTVGSTDDKVCIREVLVSSALSKAESE